METFDIENFPTSEVAKELLHMVSEEFYEQSYVGKWLFQVFGIEWDEVKQRLEELPDQLFIETATWGLMWHEIKWGLPVRKELSYEQRRQLLYARRDFVAPMTPYTMEQYIMQVTGVQAKVSDIHDLENTEWIPEHPNVFRVDFYSSDPIDIDKARKAIMDLKQSHTDFLIGYSNMIDTPYGFAGFVHQVYSSNRIETDEIGG